MEKDNSGFYRFMPVSRELGLEPFKVEGVIWPSQEYYEQVSRLSEHVGERLYIFSGLGINPEHKILEGIIRIDEQMLYDQGTMPLLPHTLLLEENRMINLTAVTHISLRYGYPTHRDAIQAIFEGNGTSMRGSMLNPEDPAIIYRSEENIQAALQRLRDYSKAIDNQIRRGNSL
jgi:hypothetical protein